MDPLAFVKFNYGEECRMRVETAMTEIWAKTLHIYYEYKRNSIEYYMIENMI
jgi:hypothetical protein